MRIVTLAENKKRGPQQLNQMVNAFRKIQNYVATSSYLSYKVVNCFETE
jgi:hypothetical protein